LASAIGLDAVDSGPLKNAHYLEPFGVPQHPAQLGVGQRSRCRLQVRSL